MTAFGGLSIPLGAPGYPLGGSSSTAPGIGDVPNVFPVALAGIPFHLDHSDGPGTGLRFLSSPRIRQQADQGRRPGEQSLNPEGDWRRSFESWQSGAGQARADARDSLDDRFNTSKGVDVWNEGEITLLPGTTESRTSANSNLYMAVAGARLYVTDGTDLLYTTDPYAVSPTYIPVTTTATQACTSLASAGHHIFVGRGTDGIWHTEDDGAAEAQWNTDTMDDVWYVKGRVMVANNNVVYNPTDSWTSTGNSLPTALFTHPNDAFAWTGMADGLNHIYMGGFAGDTSEIYRTLPEPDGTTLDVPVVAGRLPEGEVLRSLEAYLGDFVLLGTDKGVRIANSDANGDLLIGPLIETGSPCRAFEGQDQYVWFTWEDYDSTEGGLGRIDLATQTQRGAPAYASDLQVTSTAAILDVVTYDSKRIFSVDGDGFYAEDTDLVASGTITTGDINYGLTEHKLAKAVEVRSCDSTEDIYGGSFTVALSTDSGTSFDTIGQAVSSGTVAVVNAGEALAAIHEVRLTLTRDGSDATLGPCVTGFSLRVHPHADSVKFVIAKLLIGEAIEAEMGITPFEPFDTFTTIENLHESQNIVTFQSQRVSYSVTVEDYDFGAVRPDIGFSGWSGTMTVRMKRV